MKKKINFTILIIFNLTILYFLRDFIFKDYFIFKDKAEIVALAGIALFLNVIVILFQKLNLSAEKKFLIIATFIGIMYIFISPLLHGIDEPAHFSRVYSFFMDNKDSGSGEYKMPRIIKEVGTTLPEHRGNFAFLDTKIDNDDLVVSKGGKGARLYTPLSYLPYLLPVWILGFLAKTNIFLIVISARFCGFLLYLIASVFAIKTVPKRKEFMALFCLMPSVISCATNITADLLTNMSIIVFMAIWYKLYYEKKKMTIKDIVLIVLTGILAGYAKMVYTIEFLLIFFLPKECFGGTKKKKAIILGAMVGIVFIATMINVFAIAGSMNDSYDNMKLQKEFIFAHPLRYIKILFSNILGNYNFFFSFTTNHTVLNNVYNPLQIVQVIYFVALLICIYKEEADLKLGKFTKLIIYFIGLLIIVIMCTSLYLQWTAEVFRSWNRYYRRHATKILYSSNANVFNDFAF